MLVLSRRTNETLVIDNNIRFTVLSVHGNQVRIGIEAPDDIIILREEIIANTHPANAVPTTRNDEVSTDEHATLSAHAIKRTNGDHHGGEQGKRRGVLGLRRRRP